VCASMISSISNILCATSMALRVGYLILDKILYFVAEQTPKFHLLVVYIFLGMPLVCPY
jgi:hypothetical protein